MHSPWVSQWKLSGLMAYKTWGRKSVAFMLKGCVWTAISKAWWNCIGYLKEPGLMSFWTDHYFFTDQTPQRTTQLPGQKLIWYWRTLSADSCTGRALFEFEYLNTSILNATAAMRKPMYSIQSLKSLNF
jgi:hypothetical protein